MRRPPKYVHGFMDRHGKPRFYFRRAGFKRVPLPGLPWSPEFMAAYDAALKGEARVAIGAGRTKPGTVNDVVVRYLSSSAFQGLASRRKMAAARTYNASGKTTATSGSGCYNPSTLGRSWPSFGRLHSGTCSRRYAA